MPTLPPASAHGSRQTVRQMARRRAALLTEESDRWQSDQVALVETVSAQTIGRFLRYELRVLDRQRGNERHTAGYLQFPHIQTSCDYGPPDFPVGTRLVIFARPGEINAETLISYYEASMAQDPRTRDWLAGRRPDGTPIPSR
jgi:hypothetical protein